MIPIPRPPHQDVEQRWADRYGYTACARVAGHDLTVCAASPNKGYLPAAVATLTQIYDGSAHPEARPRLVRLTNSGTQGDNQHSIGLEVPARHRCRPQPRSHTTGCARIRHTRLTGLLHPCMVPWDCMAPWDHPL